MKMMKRIYFLSVVVLLAGIFSCSGGHHDEGWELSSLDGRNRITFRLTEGQPYYQVDREGAPVILASRMGISFEDTTLFSGGYEVVSVDTLYSRSTWTPVYGEHARIEDQYRGLVVHLRAAEGKGDLGIEFRAYNEGVAFRYIFLSREGDMPLAIADEKTEFVFPGDERCFASPRHGYPDNFENPYDPVLLSMLKDSVEYITPFLVEQQGHWVMITEAALDNYSGMALVKGGRANILRASLARPAGKTCRVCPSLPYRSPWRVFLLAPRAGDMIGQTLLLNLNEPSKIEDPSWIRPGKATWPWWNGRITGKGMRSGEPSTAVMQYYTDFAARHGIPYLIVDAGWYSLESDAWSQPEKEDVLTMEETRKDFYDIRQVLDYANSKGVGVFLWVHFASMKDRVDTVLATYARWGAAGIKLDNFGGEDQEVVNTLHRIIRSAARYHLMVDYHGAYKPTGYARTWPNYMTCEAVRGMEFSKGSSNAPEGALSVTHTVTIPFTRGVVGPMDFTPGVFDLDGTAAFPESVTGTRARQIAMHVVYYSPIQMLPDYPGAYESAPQQFDFLMKVPVTWDDTRFLDGYPGREIITARRKGDTWWIGLMTGKQPQTMRVTLSMLDEGEIYKAVILQDGDRAADDPQDVKITTHQVKKDDVLEVKVVGGGGAAIRLTPEKR